MSALENEKINDHLVRADFSDEGEWETGKRSNATPLQETKAL